MDVFFEKTLVIGLLVVIVFATLAHGVVEPWSVLGFEVMIAILVMIWAIKAVIERQIQFDIPSLIWPLIGLIGLGLIQSISRVDATGIRQSLSLDVESTRRTTLGFVALLFYCLLATNLFTNRERLRLLAKFLVLFGGAIGIFGLVQQYAWTGSVYWIRQVENKPFGPFINKDHFAGFMELLIALPLALILTRAVRGERRLLYGVAALMMGIAAVFTLSRGGMVSMLAELVFLAVLSYRRNRLLLGYQNRSWLVGAVAVGALVMAITLGVVWIGAEPVINRIDPNNPQNLDMGRGEIWRDTLAMISHHPILGVGLGAYETSYPIYARDNGTQGVVAEAHNDYLQILADGGLIGGLLMLWLIVMLVRAVRRSTIIEDQWYAGLAMGAGAGLLGILIHSFFDFNLHLPSHALVFWVLSIVVSRLSELAAEPSAIRVIPPHLATGVISEASS